KPRQSTRNCSSPRNGRRGSTSHNPPDCVAIVSFHERALGRSLATRHLDSRHYATTPVWSAIWKLPVARRPSGLACESEDAFVTCSKNLCCPAPGARDAQPKGPQASHEIPLVVAIAIDPALARPPFVPLPAGTPV